MSHAAASRMDPATIAGLWESYAASGERAVRDRLALGLAPLVRHVVYRKVRELPASCDAEDLLAAGMEVLLGCIERYEPSRGATLEQFVWTRVQGAVLDEMRRQDWASRTVRHWQREISRASDRHLGAYGRAATESELCSALGIGADQLRRRQQDVHRAEVHSLNVPAQAEDENTVERIDALLSLDTTCDPAQALVDRETRDEFRAAFAELDERDRTIAVLLYVEELPLAEIGARLGISESRVCQIHKSMRLRLREALQETSAPTPAGQAA